MIAAEGSDPVHGAGPLKRVSQRHAARRRKTPFAQHRLIYQGGSTMVPPSMVRMVPLT